MQISKYHRLLFAAIAALLFLSRPAFADEAAETSVDDAD